MEATKAMILPIVHLNGTSQDALVEQRCQAGSAIRAALDAMGQMAPNGRDYYPRPGLFELAVAQHERRCAMLRTLLTEIAAEAEAIADVGSPEWRAAPPSACVLDPTHPTHVGPCAAYAAPEER